MHYLLFLCVFAAFCSAIAQAQKFDVAVGASTIDAPGAQTANSINHLPQSLTGGAYLVFTGDYFFHNNFGVDGEFTRRYNQSTYDVLNVPYRPMFFDLNGIFKHRLIQRATFEGEAGAGLIMTRFYPGGCGSSSNCYTNRNHFLVDFGAAIKWYPAKDRFIAKHIFLRPEGRYYLIRNNQEFSSDQAIRYGGSIGYSF